MRISIKSSNFANEMKSEWQIKFEMLSSEYIAACKKKAMLESENKRLRETSRRVPAGEPSAREILLTKELEKERFARERTERCLAEKSAEIELLRKDNASKDLKISCLETDLMAATKEKMELRSQYDSLYADYTKLCLDFTDAKAILEQAQASGYDTKAVVKLLLNKMFNHSSERTAILSGKAMQEAELIKEKGVEAFVKAMENKHVEVVDSKGVKSMSQEKLEALASDIANQVEALENNGSARGDGAAPDSPSANDNTCNADGQATSNPDARKGKATKQKRSQKGKPKANHTYTCKELKEMGIDTSNLPDDAVLIKTKRGLWYVTIFEYVGPRIVQKRYLVGRFRSKGNPKPISSNHPAQIISRIPLSPSFAGFYLNTKIGHNVSENQMLEMLEEMGAHIPQTTLNQDMHRIMGYLYDKLYPPCLKIIKESHYTNNDGTRILVRSRKSKDEPFKYRIEYIHGVYSKEKLMFLTLYEDGSRSHEVQEKVFVDSNIRAFTCDRYSGYKTIVKDLVQYKILRSGCWAHGRRKITDAALVDSRVEPLRDLFSALFILEIEAKEMGLNAEQRLKFRLKNSAPIVEHIHQELLAIQRAGNEFCGLVQDAVNYMLADWVSFTAFLLDGEIELSNNGIERMFRHLAVGRRNWIQAGSHEAAKHISFIYGLYESCKLNHISFEKYIVNVLDRMAHGETDYEMLVPCNFKFEEVPKDELFKKPSEEVLECVKKYIA